MFGIAGIRINFAYAEKAIYFHGALAGEKYELMKEHPKATFLAHQPFSSIPSTVMSKDGSACPASTLYRSAYVKGRASVVTAPEEKALALQRMMEKNQPEGGYLDFPKHLEFYASELKAVGVFKVTVESFSVKNKFVQNRTREQKSEILAFLERRGSQSTLPTLGPATYATYATFVAANAAFMALTRRRPTSYWARRPTRGRTAWG